MEFIILNIIGFVTALIGLACFEAALSANRKLNRIEYSIKKLGQSK